MRKLHNVQKKNDSEILALCAALNWTKKHVL